VSDRKKELINVRTQTRISQSITFYTSISLLPILTLAFISFHYFYPHFLHFTVTHILMLSPSKLAMLSLLQNVAWKFKPFLTKNTCTVRHKYIILHCVASRKHLNRQYSFEILHTSKTTKCLNYIIQASAIKDGLQ